MLSKKEHSREVGNKMSHDRARRNKSVGAISYHLLVIDVRNCSHERWVIASSLASPEKAEIRIMDS